MPLMDTVTPYKQAVHIVDVRQATLLGCCKEVLASLRHAWQ